MGRAFLVACCGPFGFATEKGDWRLLLCSVVTRTRSPCNEVAHALRARMRNATRRASEILGDMNILVDSLATLFRNYAISELAR